MVERELPWSWHRSSGWRGQWERIRRWHRRLIDAATPEEAEDFLYAFFQNCYSLRDWLAPPEFQTRDVNELFENSTDLRLCRDIANMTKHFELSRQPATGREPSLAREYAGPGQGWFEDDSNLVVLSDGKNLDARELAARCLAVLERFLASGRAA